ncbi:hypothetical protein ACR3K2_22950 [Cryptosporidium serpentis]
MGCSFSKPAAKSDSKPSNDIERQRILAEKKAELAKAMKKPQTKNISRPLTETEPKLKEPVTVLETTSEKLLEKEGNPAEVNEPTPLTKPESVAPEEHTTEINKPAEK